MRSELALRRLVVFASYTAICLGTLVPAHAQLKSVNAVLGPFTTETRVLGTTFSANDDIANGNWSFSESNMDPANFSGSAPGGDGFNNNRHEFYFSEDGFNPILVQGNEAWDVSFDVALNSPFADPRKAFNFAVFDGPNSFVNLTSNRSVQPNTGAGAPPGEAAMFGGQFSFLRLLGPFQGTTGPEGDYNLNGVVDAPDYLEWRKHVGAAVSLASESTTAATPGLVDREDFDFWQVNFGATLENQPNPTAGYVLGTTVSLRIIHIPSPDGGTTPSTVELIYDDGSTGAPYTTGPRNLRNNGIFNDNARLGFLTQGIVHESVGVDSYSVTVSNFTATIGTLPSQLGSVPEPSSFSLILFAMAVIRRRVGRSVGRASQCVQTHWPTSLEDRQ